MAKAIDHRALRPCDFAILVSGLPDFANEESCVAKFFKHNAVEGQETEIVQVIICASSLTRGALNP